MAHVSIRWSKDSGRDLKYIEKDRGTEDVRSSLYCQPETAAQEFESVRSEFGKESGNQCLHVVQSWSPQESTRRSPEEFNAMGRRLAEEHFPDHQSVIRTHTDQGHIHNHIVVNTVNFETGKKIENKRKLIQDLRDRSDTICKENGLSVIHEVAKERGARLPIKVQQMVRAGKKSYIFDLVQKANVARSISTHFDEYRDTLSGFGIRTVIEEKNITYFYPGREQGKRGSKLGRDYDKSGLMEAFKANDEKFAKAPELKSILARESSQIQKYGMPRTPEGVSRFFPLWDDKTFAWNDYTRYTKVSRRNSQDRSTSEDALLTSFVPASEIKRAKENSILYYCEKNRIALTKNDRGETVIQGKEFVSVTAFEFKNQRNGTRGSLIDLVSAHKNLTLIQAVAHINNNPRLLLLEQHAGPVKQSYRSFYLPLKERADHKTGVEKITHLLTSLGAHSTGLPEKLLTSALAAVDRKGATWLFPKGGASGAWELFESPDGSWKKKSHGVPKSPFFAETQNSRHAVIFFEPFSLLKFLGLGLFEPSRRRFGVLGLFEPDPRVIHSYLAENRHIKSVQFVASSMGQPTKAELDLFNNLKGQYQKLGVKWELASHERELGRSERDRDFSPSF